MEVIVKEIAISADSLTPTLIVYAHIKYYFFTEVPISISGSLKTTHKTIATLHEIEIDRHTAKDMQLNASQPNHDDIYNAKLILPLSYEAIEHIELIRERHPQKSVEFAFDFIVKSLKVSNSVPLLQVQTEKCQCQYSINQSVWIDRYTEYLKIGKFLLLEVLIPGKQKVSAEWIDLYDRLHLRLQQMETNIRKGYWEEVMKGARQFYENINLNEKKDVHKEYVECLRELFIKDGHTMEGFEEFKSAISFFFRYVSKFIHDHDTKGHLHSIPNANKEDAYFAYSLAIGLLNTIGKKLSKQNRNTNFG